MRLLLFLVLLLLPLAAFAQSTPPTPSGINAHAPRRGHLRPMRREEQARHLTALSGGHASVRFAQ